VFAIWRLFRRLPLAVSESMAAGTQFAIASPARWPLLAAVNWQVGLWQVKRRLAAPWLNQLLATVEF
jgi:hypothetical protein